MRPDLFRQNEQKNGKYSIILLVSIMILTSLVSYLIGGGTGILLAAFVGLALVMGNRYSGSLHYLRLLRASQLTPQIYPDLHRILGSISRRAGLQRQPQLYSIRSRFMNAFVVGREEDAAIVLTDSLLRNLNLREVAGILGHEVAHIRNQDLSVMSLASTAVRLVYLISTVGQVVLLLALPYILLGHAHVAALPLMLIFFAPTVCLLLQMALSRTREYEADRTGAELAGDAYGLISALEKLERYHRGVLSRYILMPWRMSQPSLLQTHPPTAERIKRLMQMTGRNSDWVLQQPLPRKVYCYSRY